MTVKVLYTIDTSPQSFVTVLREKQDVFVHPRATGVDQLGSCGIKALARGICFARWGGWLHC